MAVMTVSHHVDLPGSEIVTIYGRQLYQNSDIDINIRIAQNENHV
jgi:hypothetical protein